MGLSSRVASPATLHNLAELFEAPDSSVLYRDFVSSGGRPGRVVRGTGDAAGVRFGLSLASPGWHASRNDAARPLTYLPGDILVKVDRAAMAAGLESRAPLLDHASRSSPGRSPPAQGVVAQRAGQVDPAHTAGPLRTAHAGRPSEAGLRHPDAEWLRGHCATGGRPAECRSLRRDGSSSPRRSCSAGASIARRTQLGSLRSGRC